jgi:hypothetical protein
MDDPHLSKLRVPPSYLQTRPLLPNMRKPLPPNMRNPSLPNTRNPPILPESRAIARITEEIFVAIEPSFAPGSLELPAS